LASDAKHLGFIGVDGHQEAFDLALSMTDGRDVLIYERI
jgi:hypothetical protein